MNMEIVWQLIRYALLAAGGVLVHRGSVTNSDVQSAVGAAMDLLTAAWGLYVKFGTKAVPVSVADRATIPTISGATGQINSGPGSQ